jgi:hypothetical protein
MANAVDNVKFFWADLPKWAKGITIIAAIGIPSYIAYTIYKNKKDEAALAKALEEQKQLEDEVANDINNGGKLSYDKSYYIGLADQLWAAFDGYGTDNQTVFDVFKKMNTNLDVKQLQLSYNNKYSNIEINSGRWNPASGYKGNLKGAIADELGNIWSGDIDYKNCTYGVLSTPKGIDVINCILKSNGVTYQF